MILELSKVRVGYGTGQVLFGIDLKVGAGQCVSLMGRNGMGKTTMVCRIGTPTFWKAVSVCTLDTI